MTNAIAGPKLDTKTAAAEAKLLNILEQSEAISGKESTGLSAQQLGSIDDAIRTLEAATSGVKDPVTSPLIDGTWKLLYTSSPGTNSPIQRKVTSTKGVAVYQVVNLLDSTGSFVPGQLPDISNTVCIGDSSRLRVTAIASTVSRPLIEPREGDGTFFGLAPFGVSSSAPPRSPLERIDFSFQEARLEIKGTKVVIPYPVPFKLLGDEAKGWIDNTYLSGAVRIARGNKGTTFVLKKVDPAADPLALLASQSIESLQEGRQTAAPTPATTSTPTAALAPPRKTSAPAATTVKQPTSSIFPRPNPRNKQRRVVVIFPAQLGTEEDYEELSAALLRQAGLQAYTAPLSRLDWPLGLVPSFFSKDYLDGTLKVRWQWQTVTVTVAVGDSG